MFKNKSLAGTYFISSFIVLLMLFASLGYFWIYHEQKEFRTESSKLRIDYIGSQRQFIKNEVVKIIDYITYKKSQTEERVRQQIKSRVYEAHALATHIYHLHKDTHNQKELQHLVREALRPIRFNDGRGYYFATSLNGIEELFADKPELEGKNLIGMQDTKGKYVIRDMIRIAKEKKKGFYEYTWTKPMMEGRDFPKIAFIKHFEPFDWFIGTGEYLDDMENEIQKEVLERVSNIRFGKDGYIFAFRFDGVYVAHIAKKYIGKNMIDITDPNGVKINRELIKAAKIPNGVYVNYVWKKPSLGVEMPKLGFAKAFHPWQWIVGTGVYLDDIDKEVNEKLNLYRSGVRRQITFILALFALSLLVTIFILRYFSGKIKNGIEAFAAFFKKSAISNEKINPEGLPFSEFRMLADYSNKMVDDRERADKALRESEERFRNLSQATFEGIVLHDRGLIIQANRQYYKMFGYRPEEFSERDAIRLTVTPDSLEKMRDKINAGDLGPYEGTGKKKDGTIFPIEIRVRQMDYNGQVVGMAAIRDISEQKKAENEKMALEARLQRAEKMEAIGTLAGGVAHDLNNVLSGLVSYPDLILMELPEDSHLRKPILTIQDSGKKAAAIVQDLLTLARRGVAVSEVVNLNDVVKGYLQSLEHKKLKKYYPKTQIETGLQKNILNILGSPVHLSKTVMNLVSNAVESLRDGGTVNISTRNEYIDTPIKGYDEVREGDYVVLTVTDNGVGIPVVDLEKIFEPFYTKKVMGRSGTGLGMAVVWGTVKDHNGYINVESMKGKGSKFTLYFPITREIADRHESASIEDFKGNGEKILVIDDVLQQRDIASTLLKTLGYSVNAVSCGEEAIEYLKNKSADLLILDMIMDPGIDGLETYRRVVEVHPGQKAIIVSGFSETESVKQAQKLGAGQYVKKPYTMEKIGLAVRAELNR